MRAMVLKGPGALALTEMNTPAVARGQVSIRVTHTGVCGTDLKIYNGSIPVGYPRVMGHEVVGEVIENGSDSRLRPGDRVIVDPMVFCGTCFHCRIGQTNLCSSGVVLGRDADGGFAQQMVVPAANIFALPPSIRSNVAPLIQVATTCLHAQRLAPIFPGEAVVVLGLGVTGQLHVQLAEARGAGPLIGITRSPFKGDLAKQFGADVMFPSGEQAVNSVLQATGGRGADLVIETTGKTSALADSIRMVRSGGRLLLFGINTVTQGSLPFYQLYFKELTLFNARAAKGEDYPACIDLVQRGTLCLEPLVTHTLNLAELERGIEMIGTDVDGRLKVILKH